jgi:hypothetical protein
MIIDVGIKSTKELYDTRVLLMVIGVRWKPTINPDPIRKSLIRGDAGTRTRVRNS